MQHILKITLISFIVLLYLSVFYFLSSEQYNNNWFNDNKHKFPNYQIADSIIGKEQRGTELWIELAKDTNQKEDL